MSVSSSTWKSGSKKPGAKSKRLIPVFEKLFPGIGCDVQNSVAIFSPERQYKPKRAACYSSVPFKLSSFIPNFSGDVFDENHTWALFGKNSTTANIASDVEFVLGSNEDLHYNAHVLIYTNKDLTVTSMDTDKDHITKFLKEMKLISKKNHEEKMNRKKNPTPGRRGRKRKQSSANSQASDAASEQLSVSSPGTDTTYTEGSVVAESHWGGSCVDPAERPAPPPLKKSRSCPDSSNWVESDETEMAEETAEVSATQIQSVERDPSLSLSTSCLDSSSKESCKLDGPGAPPTVLQSAGMDPNVICSTSLHLPDHFNKNEASYGNEYLFPPNSPMLTYSPFVLPADGQKWSSFDSQSEPGLDDLFWNNYPVDDGSNPSL